MSTSQAKPTPALVVAAVLVDDLDRPRRLLAARRSTPADLAGQWEFPGGKVEPGEDPRAGLRRELEEELGVTVVLGAELPGPAGCWPISAAYEMRVWFARVSAGTLSVATSHDELRWLTAAELPNVPWLDADRAVVEALVRLL